MKENAITPEQARADAINDALSESIRARTIPVRVVDPFSALDEPKSKAPLYIGMSLAVIAAAFALAFYIVHRVTAVPEKVAQQQIAVLHEVNKITQDTTRSLMNSMPRVQSAPAFPRQTLSLQDHQRSAWQYADRHFKLYQLNQDSGLPTSVSLSTASTVLETYALNRYRTTGKATLTYRINDQPTSASRPFEIVTEERNGVSRVIGIWIK